MLILILLALLAFGTKQFLHDRSWKRSNGFIEAPMSRPEPKKKQMTDTEKIIEDGREQLILTWGDEAWLYNAYPTRDDAGTRLLVEVVDSLYTKDVLPRRIGNCFIVVMRVPGAVATTTPPAPQIAKA